MNYIKDKLFRTDVKNPYKQNASLFHEVLGEYVRRRLPVVDDYYAEELIRKRVVDHWNNLQSDEVRLEQLALWSCVGVNLDEKLGSGDVTLDPSQPISINLKWRVFRDRREDFESGLYDFLNADALQQDSFIIDMVNRGELSFRASLEFLQRPKLLSIVENEYMLFKKPLADVCGRIDLFWIAFKKARKENGKQ